MSLTEPALDLQRRLPRWRAVCAYDGTDLFGWQSQPGGNTVQDFVEARLAGIFSQAVRIHGSGRTDSGVHATGQVFHFDGEWPHTAAELERALRSGLPASIQVTAVRRAEQDFHARYSAKGKRYRYRLYRGYASPLESRYCWSLGERELDITAMQQAGAALVGRHDFSALSAGLNREQGDPVKDLRRLEVQQKGRRLTVVTEGSGYLYKMVRTLAGALVEVGLGKLQVAELVQIRDSGQRTCKIPTAPARGLCLEKVFYS